MIDMDTQISEFISGYEIERHSENCHLNVEKSIMEEVDIKIEEIISGYNLERHIEGGWFKEIYTSEAEIISEKGRKATGSIYYLLDKNNVSHFHVIDCEEIWFFHSGCGMNIYCIDEKGNSYIEKLGMNSKYGEKPMVIIPKGCIFAAENTNKELYTFVSCVTSPKFRYEGFRLVKKSEIDNNDFPEYLFCE